MTPRVRLGKEREGQLEEEKYGLAVVACGKAKLLAAKSLEKSSIVVVLLLAAAVVYFGNILEPAFAELPSAIAQAPDTSAYNYQQQAPAGNLYYRSMSESLSLAVSHGSGNAGTNPPLSHHRSISESLSVSTTNVKAPNSYSRSMTEQASLNTGMPPSSAAPAVSQPYRASSSLYSASSSQRLDERFGLRNLSGGKADLNYRSIAAGTSIYSTESVMLDFQLSGSSAGIIIQDAASSDSESEDAADSNSLLLSQLEAVNEYSLMQKNYALANLSTSAAILLGTVSVVVARQPAVASGRLQNRVCMIFLLKHNGVQEETSIQKTSGKTRILVLVLVIFTSASIINAVDPLAGQAFAAITFVGAGTSSSTNGAAPTPALPSNLQDGDLMIAYFYSREVTDGTVSISAGWTEVYNERTSGGLLAAWYRVYQAGDVAPTFTLGGHVSANSGGDTAGAQIAAWRGVDTADPIDVTGTIATNAAQQNIGPISGITVDASDTVIVMGGKTDDWSSVATLSGDSLTWAEIGEPDSTSGADAGLVWDYAINGASQTPVTDKTFTVTGGATAAGKGVMFSLNLGPTTITVSASEQLGMSETVTKRVSRAMTEQLGMTEMIVVIQVKPVSEQLGMSETIVVRQLKPLSEQMGMSESITKRVSRAITESMAFTDTIAARSNRSVIDSMSLSESITMRISRSVSDALSLSASTRIVVSKAISDSLSVSETIRPSITKTVSDQVEMSETIAVRPTKPVSEQLATSESIVKSVNKVVTVQLGMSETIGILMVKPLSEEMGMSEVLVIQVVKPLAEEMGMLEMIAIQVVKPLSEEMGMLEMIGILMVKPLAEELGMSESMVIQVVKPLAEELAAIETLDREFTGSRSQPEQLELSETVATASNRPILEQITMTESITTAISKPLTELLSIQDTIAMNISRSMEEQMAIEESIMMVLESSRSEALVVSEAIERRVVFTRNIQDDMAVGASASKSSSVEVLDSMGIGDEFTDISVVLYMTFSETLVMVQSFATQESGLLDAVSSGVIDISDAVDLTLHSLQTPTEGMAMQDQIASNFTGGRSILESMQMGESRAMSMVRPPPSPPAAIATMPAITMALRETMGEIGSISDPRKATEVDGVRDMDAFDSEALGSILETMGMPVYDVSIGSSPDIDEMTIVLPTFSLSAEINGIQSDDGIFLTPIVSNLPSGMQVWIPIDVAESLDDSENLNALGNMTVSFTPADSADDFAMMLAMLDNNPESVGQTLPEDISAFFIDASFTGNFGGATPANSTFFQELPQITFTVDEEWTIENQVERENGVPAISLFLLDETTGEWIEISDIELQESAVDGTYTYAVTLPHFSTYLVSANKHIPRNGGDGQEFNRSLSESLSVNSIMGLSEVQEIGGQSIIKNLAESMTINVVVPEPLHQRVITIQNVSVAVSVADVRSAALFGTAVATLNFEITNKNGAEEDMVLRYWYSDPASGKMLYEGEQAVTVGAGQSLGWAVEIPFYSEGVFDLMIEAKSDDGTLATTDIVIKVPWLAVYLYALVAAAIVVVLISLFYVIFAMRRSRRRDDGER
jgi:hypothetical protein